MTAWGGAVGRDLRWCLLALVFLNLVFVQISSGVGTHWMVPMFALTLAAPVLSRFQPSVVYRGLWNTGVLAIFALLVRDGTQTGVRYLLEDGLILAAFCQVHLLNNLGPRQKPDLLFFNSFLIALVTSFFCQDVAFAAVFAIYAFVLVISLQLSCSRESARARGMLADGARKASVALLVTMLVFTVWPRDFTREGLVEETLRGSGVTTAGFTEQVELGRSARAVMSNRVVLRARLLEGDSAAVPQHWRGATFVWYDGRRWHADDQPQQVDNDQEQPWLQPLQGRLVRPGLEMAHRLEVVLEDRELRRVFAPLPSHAIAVDNAERGLFFMPLADGTLKFVTSRDFEDTGRFTYQLDLHALRPEFSSIPGSFGNAVRSPHLLASIGLPEGGAELAHRIASQSRGQPQHRVVAAMAGAVSELAPYLLPGAQGAADSLHDFFEGEGGHCEYFATALALMLRSSGIPCRLVTGYSCTEWDEEQTTLIVRSRHAHAWVEVLDPSGGWYAVDPTPAAGLEESVEVSWYEVVSAQVSSWWNEIASFDGEAREAALQWLSRLPGRSASWVAAHPFASSLLAALALSGFGWWRRRRLAGPVAVRNYLVAVRRAGLQTQPGETPRELLQRARTAQLGERAMQQLERATVAHEIGRYS